MGAALHRQMDQLARRQLGLASTRQLEELGFGRRSRARAVASGRLVRFRRGAHLTAARLWQLEPDRNLEGDVGAIHLTAPAGIRIAGVVAHIRKLRSVAEAGATASIGRSLSYGWRSSGWERSTTVRWAVFGGIGRGSATWRLPVGTSSR